MNTVNFFKKSAIAFIIATVAFAGCEKDAPKPSHTVTFDSAGGSIVAAQTVEEGGTAARPEDPTRTGYVFDNWYLGSASAAYSFNTPVTTDITLTAKWLEDDGTIEYWNITWNLNGGAWAEGSNPAEKVIRGRTLAEPNAPVKEGSAFEGWYKESAFVNKITFPCTVTADMTLYAKWTGEDPVDDSNLKTAAYCLAHIMKVTEDKKKGINIYNISGVTNVVYNSDNTINYMDFIYYDAVVPFLYNTPVVISGVDEDGVNAARAARNAISSGSYDYANDPSEIIAYFGSFSGPLFFSVSALEGKSTIEKMRLVANNEGITADALNKISFSNNSYKILIFGKNRAGILIGKYVGSSTYNTTQSQLYFDYLNIDPDDTRFGELSRMEIP